MVLILDTHDENVFLIFRFIVVFSSKLYNYFHGKIMQFYASIIHSIKDYLLQRGMIASLTTRKSYLKSFNIIESTNAVLN